MNEASNFCTGEICRLPAVDRHDGTTTSYDEAAMRNDCPLRCMLRPDLQALAAQHAANGLDGDGAAALSTLPEALPLLRVLRSGAAAAAATGSIGGNITAAEEGLLRAVAGVITSAPPGTSPGGCNGLADPPYQISNSNTRAPQVSRRLTRAQQQHQSRASSPGRERGSKLLKMSVCMRSHSFR